MRDLTKGSIIRLMLLFSLPILLGSLFQQAYNLVDIIIVGKKLGELSLSAVGSTTAVVSLMFNIINGLCTGFAIPVAKHYGANDMNKVRRTVAGMITYSAIITALIMALCIVFVEPLLTALNTPAEIFEQAKLYLTIVAGGLIVTLICEHSSCFGRQHSTADNTCNISRTECRSGFSVYIRIRHGG